MRHDTEKELEILNRLYSKLRLYTNYFLPSMKLVEKTRIGSKVVKRYDKPKTPYERLLGSPDISAKIKKRLRAEYDRLNPAGLKREITRLQTEIARANSAKRIVPNEKTIRPPRGLS
jgi:hypothetical protein